ncbi:MAG: RagB/SusD family nutrient uptake outer membrane protein [Flavobacteriaceae bacterium]|nr:RagB/SusD family nutrient uptake outer membrane protein [Flavobacteriaceae bacterium]
MKNIITLFSILLLLSSCSDDFLERRPKDKLSSESFWQSKKDARLALMGCYNQKEGSLWDVYTDGYVDNAYCQYPWESNATNVSAGNITAESDFGYSLMGIRRFNYFLDNIEKAPIDNNIKKGYKAEVRTLRAWAYFNLAKAFGAVPLITKYTIKPEEVSIAPTPEEEVIKFVIDELNASIKDLPATQPHKTLINKAAALTFKARVHLFYNQWAEAMQASQKVMGMGYELFKINELTDADKADDYSKFVDFSNDTEKEKFLKGLRSYEQLFWAKNEKNIEIILEKEYIEDKPTYLNVFLLPDNPGGGWSSITPTQELVDAYWTNKGEKFTPPTAEQRAMNFNDAYKDDKQIKPEYLNEFKNRDTRLYASILFPEAIWNALMGDKSFVWAKGKSNTSKVGYNFRKLVDPNVLEKWKAPQNFPLIRYAEVLLNYAEAKNEVSGPDASVYEALDQIRERVGMPKINRAKVNTKELLREVIRNERRIELAAEGFRWDDVRRWNIIGDVMKSIRSIDNDLAQERKWEKKFIRFPYPQSAIDRNPNLKGAQQAKGY